MTDVEALIKIRVQEEVSKAMTNARNEVLRTQSTLNAGKQAVTGFFGTFTGPLGATAAGAALAALVQRSAQTASALQAMERRAQSIFGDALPRMRREADALGESLGRSSSDILGYQSDIASIAQAVGITGPPMEEMSQRLSQLTVDFGAYFDIADPEAFRLMQGAVLGQTKALQRYGIILNDATLQEFAYSKGIRTKIADMGEAQQMLLRYQALLDATSKIQGAAAGNADSYAEATKRLSAEWTDFQEAAGTAFLPALAAGVNAVTESINRLMSSVVFLKNQFNFKLAEENGLGVRTDGQNVLLDYAAPGFRARNEEMMSVAKATEEAGNAAKETEQDWRQYFRTLGGGSASSEKAAKDAEAIKKAMDELGRSAQQQSRSIDQDLKQLEMSYKDKMASIRDEIAKTKKSVQDLREEENRRMQGFANDEADLIMRQEKAIVDKRKELAEKERERESILQSPNRSVSVQFQEDYDALKKEVADMEADLAEARRGIGVRTQSALQTRGVRSEFGNEVADLRDRREQEMAQSRERSQELRGELTELENKKRLETEAYTIQRQQFELTKSALEQFRNDYEAAMTDINTVTQETVDNLKLRLEDMRNAISQIDALVAARSDLTGGGSVASRRAARLADTPDSFLPKLAEGGVVTRPTVALIGEAGPEAVIPLSKAGMGGVSITIQSMTVHKEADVDAVMARLAREIRKQTVNSA